MTATAHAVVGAAIGAKIGNPALAMTIALLSHFVFDKIPHWDVMTDKDKYTKNQIIIRSIVDVLLSGALTAFFILLLYRFDIAAINWWTAGIVALCALMAQLPDWLETPYTMFKISHPIFSKNHAFQKWVHDVGFDARLKAPWGIVIQIVISVIFLLWGVS